LVTSVSRRQKAGNGLIFEHITSYKRITLFRIIWKIRSFSVVFILAVFEI